MRGLINRRYWFAFTDKIEEANFVWTQLKELNYYPLQKDGEKEMTKLESKEEYPKSGILTLSDKKKFEKYW